MSSVRSRPGNLAWNEGSQKPFEFDTWNKQHRFILDRNNVIRGFFICSAYEYRIATR